MPECRCRNADAGLSVVNKRKTNDAGLTFLSAFRHSGIHACPLSSYMLHYQSCAVCPCQCSMSMSMSMYIYMEMPEFRTVRHLVSPVSDWKKLTMPEQVRYRTKLTQSGIFLVQYRTKIRDAGMPMPALVSSMLMPSYAYERFYYCSAVTFYEDDILLFLLRLLNSFFFYSRRAHCIHSERSVMYIYIKHAFSQHLLFTPHSAG